MTRSSLPGAGLSITKITVTVPLKVNTCKTISNNGPERLSGLTDAEELGSFVRIAECQSGNVTDYDLSF